jgi:LytS/YehU family sensor histidine kinase
MIKASTSKGLSFIAMMAALGNVLSFLSIQLSPLIPSRPLGPINFSLALDLSHLATFTAALLGGPVIGGLTGLVGGFVAAFQFGFSQGNIITGIGLPLGKAVTGIVAGMLLQRMKNGGLKIVLATVISYVPEAIFTAVIFIILYPIYYSLPVAVAELITLQILVKAFAEMMILGVLLGYISWSKPFQNATRAFAS